MGITMQTIDRATAELASPEAAGGIFDLATRQGQIGQAALELFYKQGFHSTGMREIAGQLGWGAANLYNFFPSKEQLLYFLLESIMKSLLDETHKHINSSADPVTQLRDAIRYHVFFHAKYQKEAFISDSELRGLSGEYRQRIVEYRNQYEAIFRDILTRGADQGYFKPMNVKLRAMGIILMCTGLEFWYRQGGKLSIEQVADDYWELVMHGLNGDARPDTDDSRGNGKVAERHRT
jgi:TetR/AcrR family transcriptional regulator, cholesterol catabolism regulator